MLRKKTFVGNFSYFKDLNFSALTIIISGIHQMVENMINHILALVLTWREVHVLFKYSTGSTVWRPCDHLHCFQSSNFCPHDWIRCQSSQAFTYRRSTLWLCPVFSLPPSNFITFLIDCLSPQHVESEDKYLSAPLPSLTSSHSDLLQSVRLLNIHSLHHSPQRFHGLP